MTKKQTELISMINEKIDRLLKLAGEIEELEIVLRDEDNEYGDGVLCVDEEVYEIETHILGYRENLKNRYED